MLAFLRLFESTVALPDTRSRSGGYVRLPGTFIRFGRPPSGAPSGKWDGGRRTGDEKGVSVYGAWHDPVTGVYVMLGPALPEVATDFTDMSRRVFEVEGDELPDVGSDEEPLLAAGSVRIIRELSYDQIVTDAVSYITLSGRELAPEEEPDWNRA